MLPPNAVGRDFRPPLCGPDRQRHRDRGEPVGPRGFKLGWIEGVEVNLLGSWPASICASRRSSCRASAALARWRRHDGDRVRIGNQRFSREFVTRGAAPR
jgi:hypothetical protein